MSEIINGVSRRVNLEQNSPEWLKWREGGLGASEIPTVMGENPYESALNLWRLKSGIDKKPGDNYFTRHGRYNEEAARQLYNEQYGEVMIPHTFESIAFPWLRASLDGINFEGDLVLEIKCPIKAKVFTLAEQGIVIPYYIGQLQCQMFVTGAKRAHFFVYFGTKTATVAVEADPAYHDRMLRQAFKLWKAVLDRRADPKFDWPWGTSSGIPETPEEAVAGALAVKTLDLSNDPEWAAAAAAYIAHKKELDMAAALLAPHEAVLKRKAVAPVTFGAGVTVKIAPRKGNVDYGTIPAIAAMKPEELDAFRKKAGTTTTIEI